MILALDIGNRNIVIGGIQSKTILFKGRLRTETSKTSDEYAIDIRMVFEINHHTLDEVEGLIVASVVPQVLNSVKTALLKLTGKNCIVVGPGVKTGINLRVENPSQTGADLVAGCVAALREYSAPVIVVNMGTATSMIVLDQSGSFIGGTIAPGVQLSLDALTARAALLPGLQLDSPRKVIGRNTVECMRSGIMYGTAAMLDGMAARMEKELNCSLPMVITGTIGRFIAPLCERTAVFDNDLVLKGLSYIYSDNAKTAE